MPRSSRQFPGLSRFFSSVVATRRAVSRPPTPRWERCGRRRRRPCSPRAACRPRGGRRSPAPWRNSRQARLRRNRGGDLHLVGGERVALGAVDADIHAERHRARAAFRPGQHAPGKAIFDDHPIRVELALPRHLGDLAAMHDRVLIAHMASLVDGEQTVARPSHHLRTMGARAARQVGAGIGLGRLEQPVLVDGRGGSVLVARLERIGKTRDGTT